MLKFLKENPKIALEIEDKVREKLGVAKKKSTKEDSAVVEKKRKSE